MSEDNSTNGVFPVEFNYARVSKEKSLMSITRILALDLMENPYLSIGAFIKGIPDSDLIKFMEMVENDEDWAMENLMVITEMLAQAEGLESKDIEELTHRCNIMTTYITIESLKRKGLVKVYYENMSFGEEFESKLIVERLFDV